MNCPGFDGPDDLTTSMSLPLENMKIEQACFRCLRVRFFSDASVLGRTLQPPPHFSSGHPPESCATIVKRLSVQEIYRQQVRG